MKKYYTESELKSFNLEKTQLDSIARHKDRLQEKLNELRKYVPEADLYYWVSEYDGKKHIENGYICFEREGILFFQTSSYINHKDCFYIEHDQFDNVDTNDILSISDNYVKPQYIEVYTQKKVDAWIDYLTHKYNDIAKLDREHDEKVNAFLKELENENVCWRKGGKSGEIRKNGLRFSFSIAGGHIDTLLTLDYKVKATLEHFKVLADNKFIAG